MQEAERDPAVEAAIEEHIGAVVDKMFDVWGPDGSDGLEGNEQEYAWLQAHFGITEKEDVQWQLVYDESRFELSSEDAQDEEVMQILRNRGTVLEFLQQLLAKYRSSDATYEHPPNDEAEDEEEPPLSQYMRRKARDLGLDPNTATHGDIYRAERRQIALDAGLDPETATHEEILHADMAMRWGASPSASTEEVNEIARRTLAHKAGLDETADWDTINSTLSRQDWERKQARLRQSAEKLGLDPATATPKSIERERLRRRAIKVGLPPIAAKREIKQAEDRKKLERKQRLDAKRNV